MTLVERSPLRAREVVSRHRQPHHLFGLTSPHGAGVAVYPLVEGLFPQDDGETGVFSAALLQRDGNDIPRFAQEEVKVDGNTVCDVSAALAPRGLVSRMVAVIPDHEHDMGGRTILHTHLPFEPREHPFAIAQWSDQSDEDAEAMMQEVIRMVRTDGGALGYHTKNKLVELPGTHNTIVMTGGQLFVYSSSEDAPELYYAITHDFHAMIATSPELFGAVLDEPSYRTTGLIRPEHVHSFHEGYAPLQQ